MRILFLHGAKGSATDVTSLYLKSHYDTSTPNMPTSNYQSSLMVAQRSLELFNPDMVVAESFGAAIAYDLIERKKWKGPTLLICPAIHRIRTRMQLSTNLVIPPDCPLWIVHGTRDTVVPLEDSVRIMEAVAWKKRQLVIVDDDHGMKGIVQGFPDVPQLKDIIGNFMDTLEQSSDTLEQSSDTLEQSSDTLEQSSDTLEQSSDTLEQSSDTLEQSADQ
jgi:uncharacterized protein YukE